MVVYNSESGAKREPDSCESGGENMFNGSNGYSATFLMVKMVIMGQRVSLMVMRVTT